MTRTRPCGRSSSTDRCDPLRDRLKIRKGMDHLCRATSFDDGASSVAGIRFAFSCRCMTWVHLSTFHGHVVQWENIWFAPRRQGFDSPFVHQRPRSSVGEYLPGMEEVVGSIPTEGSSSVRVWSNGLASGFQPEDASSILAARSRSNARSGVHSLGELPLGHFLSTY